MNVFEFQKALDRLWTRIAMSLARAALRHVDDSGGIQLVQLDMLNDETKDKIEHFQPYGLSAHPESAADAFVVFPGGDRSHGIAVVIDDRRYRPTDLESGEVVLYSKFNQRVLLRKDGTIVVDSPDKHVIVKAKNYMRFEAEDIEFICTKSFKWDVNGMGVKWIAQGYLIKNYTIGATSSNHAISPSEYEPSGVE